MSAMPPRSCLRSKRPACALRRVRGAGARACLRHLLAQIGAPHGAFEHLDAHRFDARHQCRIAGHRARMQQRLVLPGPGFLELVAAEGLDAGHQHAALARGPQPHVDLVQPAGSRMHGQQVDQPLRVAQEEHLVVHRRRGIGFLLLTGAVMQEHQVQVRTIAQLVATELAVGQRRDASPGGARRLPCNVGWPYCASRLPQHQRHGASTISAAISVSRSLTCISGSRPDQIRQRHAEYRRLLEARQLLHFALDVVPARPRRGAPPVPLPARRDPAAR